MGVLFDKLNFMKRLEDGGTFTRPQAQTLSEAFHEAVAESVATKQDVAEVRHETAELRTELKTGLSHVRTELNAGLSELRTEMSAMRSDMKASNAETKVWAVSVGATIVAVLAAMKYFG
jgi:cytochrome c-type biogenesis protein CcmH/NrfG